jgi:hypothetical protein
MTPNEVDDGSGRFSHTFTGNLYDGSRESSFHALGGFCMMQLKTVEWVGDSRGENQTWL